MTQYVGAQIGDYRIVERIGSGGMGAVYRAEHMHLGKSYALKVLDDGLVQGPDFVARFYDEARVMAELRHRHIVQVQHMGSADGVYFLVMDYVTGPGGKPLSLHEYLRDCPGGRLDGDQARKWAVQITEALAYAHGRGVVHRDLKPANLLIDADGNVKLTDFGLAKAVGEEFVLFQLHRTLLDTTLARHAKEAKGSGPVREALDTMGAADLSGRTSGASGILGTYDYMAPEQRGEGTGRVDERTDIYSFGVLLYRMLTGRRPVALAKRVSQAAAGVSKRWDAIVSRCLAEDPDARYGSAGKLLKDLNNVLGHSRLPAFAGWAAVFVAIALAVAVPLMRLAQASSTHVRTPAPPLAAAPDPAAAPAGRLPPVAQGANNAKARAEIARKPAQVRSELDRRYSETEKQVAGLSSALKAVQQDVAERDERIQGLSRKLRELEGLRTKADAASAAKQAEIARQLTQTREQLSGLEKIVLALREEVAGREAGMGDLAGKIRQLVDDGRKTALKQAELAAQLKGAQDRMASLKGLAQSSGQARSSAKQAAEQLAGKIRQLEKSSAETARKQEELAWALKEARDGAVRLKKLIQLAQDRPAAGKAAETAGGVAAAAREPAPMRRDPSAPVIAVATVREGWARIDAGRAKGVELGMKLGIYRGSQFVSSLVIAELSTDTASGILVGRRLAPAIGDHVMPSQ